MFDQTDASSKPSDAVSILGVTGIPAIHGGLEQTPRHGQVVSRWAVGVGDAADVSAIDERSAWVGARRDLASLDRACFREETLDASETRRHQARSNLAQGVNDR